MRKELVKLFPKEETARHIVDIAGIKSHLIAFSSQAISNWHAILTQAKLQEKIPQLIEAALEFQESPVLADLLTAQERSTPEPQLIGDAETIRKTREKLEQLVARGRIEEVFDPLLNLTGAGLRSEVLQLQSKWSTLQRDQAMGGLRYDDAQVEKNKIIGGLLYLLGKLK